MKSTRLLACACLLISLFAAPPLQARKAIQLATGQSKVIPVDHPQKVAIGNPEVADVTTVSNYEILLNAKGKGVTTLIVWSKNGRKDYTEVVVLEKSLEKTMIEIKIEVLEISDLSSSDLGLDWISATNKGLRFIEGFPPPLMKLGTFQRGNLYGYLKLLTEEGKAKILARPRLLTLSGSEAKFLAGGEIPVVLTEARPDNKARTVHVEWKGYGVKLDITPTADIEGNINATLRAEVSSLDMTNAVLVGDSMIPAIRTRWVNTSVYVEKGGTLVIAGLISESDQEKSTGLPILSRIPLLGNLFKSTTTIKEQTELLIFVTPKIFSEEETAKEL